MSIFPDRLCAVDDVIFHLFFSSEDYNCINPVEAHLSIIDPHGGEIFNQMNYVLVKPLADERCQYQGASLHVLTQCAKAEKGSLDEFYERFVCSTHFYMSYSTSEGALPGKYKVKALVLEDGQEHRSSTEEHDCFYVDSITIESASMHDGRMHVRIRNNSPEKTPIRMVEFGQDPTRCQTTFMTLDSSIVTDLSFADTQAKLFFCENRRCLSLNLDNSPYVLKNQRYKTVLGLSIGKEADAVYLVKGEEIVLLDEQAKNIWELANGVSQKSIIYTQNNSKIYKQMLDSEIIFELTF